MVSYGDRLQRDVEYPSSETFKPHWTCGLAGREYKALASSGSGCTFRGSAEEDRGVTMLCYAVHDVCCHLLCCSARLCSCSVINQHDLDERSRASGRDAQGGLCFVHLGYGHPHASVFGLPKTQGDT